MFKLFLIAAGGGFGAVARYLLSGWMQRLGGGVFPLGTLTVNVCGCLLIGVLSAFFAGPQLVREEYRVALLVGLLGGVDYVFHLWMGNDGPSQRRPIGSGGVECVG